VTVVFNEHERAVLRRHGFVLFANRVIFEAQPPLAAARVAEIAALCAAPLPAELLALWRECAGGSLDYDLDVPMLGRSEAVSWCELFFDGSDGYRDLRGWIEQELELAREAAEADARPFDGKLRYLPIGGFEYTDRIYVAVDPRHPGGRVDAWKMGLPPAWQGALHEDAICPVAPNLLAAFGKLTLHEDPRAPRSAYASGETLLQHIEEQVADQALERGLADKLVEYYCAAVT
jgi:hypothetical protein